MLRWGVLTGVVVALIGASSAGAATYCVNKPGCVGTNTTLTNALDLADANMDEDTIFIGANGGVPYTATDNFAYNFAGDVNLIGDGAGQTILQGTAAANINDRQTLTLLGSSGSTVTDMTIIGPTANGGAERALVWQGTASRVEIVQKDAPGQAAADARGTAVLEDSSIDTDVQALFTAVNAVTLTVRDSTILAPNNSGISVDSADSLNLQRTSITSGARAVQASGAGTTANLINVVLRKTTSSPSFGIVTALTGAVVTARHATMIGAGGGRGFDVDNLPNATATLRDSIIVNVATPIYCASNDDAQPSSMTVAYSNFGPGSDVSDPGCNESLSNNDNTTTPVFVDVANHDYRLIGGSPLINAADPADPIANDFFNVARPVAGRTDMGAFEYRAQAPTATILSAPPTAATGEEVAFTGTGTDADDDPLTYAWDFGDGASAAGATTTHAFAAGSYDVTLTVTDSAGLTSAATATIVVSDPTQPPPPQLNPKLSDFKAEPKKIKARKQAPKLVPGGTRGLVFNLEEAAAKVTLTLVRCKGRRGCSRTKAVNGSANFDAPIGASAIVFKGSLDGKRKLRKGRYIVTLTPAGGDPVTTKLKIV